MLSNGHFLRSLRRISPFCNDFIRGTLCESESFTLQHRKTGIALSRGVKTRSTFQLRDLPLDRPDHGVALPKIEDGSSYPTVVQQAQNNMRKYRGCVLLTRVGSFYELYFEQADKYGPLLNLKVAKKKTAAGPVAMVNSSTL